MNWYCGNCGYPNGPMDLYCCHCHRIKDSLAFKDEALPSIAPTIGPLPPVAFTYNTHYDDNHEHHEASPSNRLDLDLASIDTTSAASQNSHEGKKRKFWYCCGCGDGPHGVGNIPACNCNHVQCTRCETVKLKTNSAHYIKVSIITLSCKRLRFNQN
jgi:hypothetical protein